MYKKLASILLISVITFGCLNYKKANEQAVEKLHSQMKVEKFDEIYNQSSIFLKEQISRDEFVEKMKLAVKSMKEIDSALNWQNPKNENEFYRDYSITDTSYRNLENGKKSIGIFIYWSTNFTLCGFETTEIKVINACS